METVSSIVKFVVEHYQEVITAIVGIFTGIIGICMLIPGEQPEKALQGIVDFIKKFSAKKD